MEAKIIKADGTEVVVTPKNGVKFNLAEMQEIVGGYIELISINKECSLILNEEGKLMGLPFNLKATQFARESLRTNDFIVGNVLVCPVQMYD